jgi:hypothetical protein
MPTGWELFLILAPAICAGAGALVAHIAHRGHCERLQDRAYEEGWRDGRDKAEAFSGTMVADYPTVIVHPPAGARHAGPLRDSPAVIAHLALANVASEFDRIRAEFGLDGIEGPAPSRAALLRYPADSIGPPSGELLRASGIDTGPPWPIAPRSG